MVRLQLAVKTNRSVRTGSGRRYDKWPPTIRQLAAKSLRTGLPPELTRCPSESVGNKWPDPGDRVEWIVRPHTHRRCRGVPISPRISRFWHHRIYESELSQWL